jgi:hypothetical protein
MYQADEGVYGRPFTAKDIQVELNLDRNKAHMFMKEHGRMSGHRRVISQREFRLLQGDGTVAAWMSAHSGKQRRTVGK